MDANRKKITAQFRNRVAEIFIRERTRRLRISRADLASQLGIAASCVGRIERAQTDISAVEWFLFCRLTGISPDIISERR
jgi:ribosome-binding protein aMBF1 (putative translation factor)